MAFQQHKIKMPGDLAVKSGGRFICFKSLVSLYTAFGVRYSHWWKSFMDEMNVKDKSVEEVLDDKLRSKETTKKPNC